MIINKSANKIVFTGDLIVVVHMECEYYYCYFIGICKQ